jgi:hypothetical protein
LLHLRANETHHNNTLPVISSIFLTMFEFLEKGL